MDMGDEGSDSLGDLFGGGVAVAGVVGANEQDNGLGRGFAQFAVLNAPEGMLGGVSSEAEVCRAEWREMGLPGVFPCCFPALGDGIAEEQDIDSSFSRFVHFCGVTGGPPPKLSGGWARFGKRG